jgi:hypothetical protein
LELEYCGEDVFKFLKIFYTVISAGLSEQRRKITFIGHALSHADREDPGFIAISHIAGEVTDPDDTRVLDIMRQSDPLELGTFVFNIALDFVEEFSDVAFFKQSFQNIAVIGTQNAKIDDIELSRSRSEFGQSAHCIREEFRCMMIGVT